MLKTTYFGDALREKSEVLEAAFLSLTTQSFLRIKIFMLSLMCAISQKEFGKVKQFILLLQKNTFQFLNSK